MAIGKRYYHKPYTRPIRIAKDEYEKPSEIFKGYRFNDLRDYGFTDVTMKLYNAVMTFDADDFMSLLETFSDHRSLDESDRVALHKGIKEAILNHGEKISLDYVFQLYMGRKSC